MSNYHLADKINGVFETFQAEDDHEAREYFEQYIQEELEIYKGQNTYEELKDFFFLLHEDRTEV
jgi:hypothetical protein